MPLDEYRRKRDFQRTPEPKGGKKAKRSKRAKALQFVVQMHRARRLHFDFRLELDGTLKSWAIPKGPSLVPGAKRMAVQVEDHPLEYGTFEGVIPAGEYGGGTVLVWDRGHWEPEGDAQAALAKGDLKFTLRGEKLRGRWHLVRMKPRPEDRGKAAWLLMKGNDADARRGTAGEITARAPASVLTGRDIDEIARDADRTWSIGRGETNAPAIGAPGDPSALTGAKKAKLPRDVRPQLATAVSVAPTGDDWVHEIKLDGYRILCRIEKGKARVFTRAGNDWTLRFPGIVRALERLPIENALLDGEAVVMDRRGLSRFQALQNALDRDGAGIQLHLFDVLHLDGWDVAEAPLVERKRLLREVVARGSGGNTIHVTGEIRGHGPEVLAQACKTGVEGIVAKRADAPYRPGRSRAWLKLKCQKRQELVIVGWTDPQGTRVGFGALLLGAYDAAGALRYCGKVGTGFDGAMLRRIHTKLRASAAKQPPVVDPERAERGAHWVVPKLVAEVEFTEWTDDGRIRHPSFLGLREDKAPRDVRIEIEEPLAETPAAPPLRSEVAGVRLSNPDRVYWPDVGVTKSELAQYYEAVAERALPGLAQRPLSLVRCPTGIDGEIFYQKAANQTIPANVARVEVERGQPYAMVTDLASLIALVQIAVLEFHVWGARADQLDRPDLLIFDLDPDPAVPWRRVADTALVLRALLADFDLVPFLRSTGGKGLHVVVPLQRRSSWDEVKGFARGLAAQIAAEKPAHYTIVASKQRRAGKIYLDFLRNAREATAIASYSTRARPGAPVAMPLFWEEIEKGDAAPRFTIRDAIQRATKERDPWRRFEASRRVLGRAALRSVGYEGE